MNNRKNFLLGAGSKKILLTLLAFTSILFAHAQDNAEKTDFMESHGKIYVVMAVVIVIVAGLFLYLFSLDRKISKLERNNKI